MAEEAKTITAREMAIIAARAADEKKATDILVQEVGELISVTEFFVIATASNNRQVRAIIEEIEDAIRKEAHIHPLHREETREFYRLEALWNDAPIMDLAAEAGLTDVQYSERIAALLEQRGDGAERKAADALPEEE